MLKARGPEYLNGPVKERLDFLGAAAATLALLPVALPTAVVAALNTHSINPFFRQERFGRSGQPFEVTKFRTILKALTDAEYESFGIFDPRATKVGQFLRSYGLDEIPQLAEVFSGKMSMVGIRPLPQHNVDEFRSNEPEFFEQWWEHAYTVAKPGLTGTSSIYRHQLGAHTPEIYRRSMELDLFYIENASLTMDLRILAGTPLELLGKALPVAKYAAAKVSPSYPA